MTKEAFLNEFINSRVRTVHNLHIENNKLIIAEGVDKKFNAEADLEKVKAEVEVLAKKIAEKVDWKLLEADEKAFRRKFVGVMLEVS